MCAFIDDITLFLPPSIALAVGAISFTTEWDQHEFAPEVIERDRSKPNVLHARGVGIDALKETQRGTLVKTGVAKTGRRMVAVTLGTEEIQRDFAMKTARGEGSLRLRTLVTKNDAQANFQVMLLSARAFLLRTPPPPT